MPRLTLRPNWLVTYIDKKGQFHSEPFQNASEAWLHWETVGGSEIAIYRRKEIKSPTGTRVTWEQIDYTPVWSERQAAA